MAPPWGNERGRNLLDDGPRINSGGRLGAPRHSRANHQGTLMSAAPETKSPGTETAELEIPSRFGQYDVVRLLARGGMSRIFGGRHPQLGRRVALKVRHPASAA